MIEKQSKGGVTPLSLAVSCGHYELVELLVERGGANVKTKDNSSNTLVHIAAMKLEETKEKLNPETAPAIFKVNFCFHTCISYFKVLFFFNRFIQN